MTNVMSEILDDLRAARQIERPNELPYEAGVLDERGTLQARQMLARVYVLTGTVKPEDLTPEGTLDEKADPYYYRGQCTYYGVWDRNNPDKLLMAARLVHPDKEMGAHSLQVHLEDLDPDYVTELLNRDPNEIAEFAAYVKAPELGGVPSRLTSLYLIREIIRDSRDRGIKTWVFGLRPQLKTKYERLFGPGLDRRGRVVHLGNFKSEFLPYSVDVEAAWRRLLDSSRMRIGSRAIARFVGMTQPSTSVRAPARAGSARAKIAH